MSPDELFVLVASIVFGPMFWMVTLFGLARIETLRPQRPVRQLTILVTGLSAGIYVVLRVLAADDVRTAPQYLLLYTLLGVAWLKAGERLSALFGVSARAGLVEGGNRAVFPSLVGALAGLALCYAGGNIGNGPGWWVVVFSAGLATIGFFMVWTVLDVATRITEAVVVGRDAASGVRLGGALAATGVVLGRSVAGNWVSAAATVTDALVIAGPVVLGLAAAVLVEGRLSPSVEQPVRSTIPAGVVPAVGYVLLAAAYVWSLGWPV